MSDFDKIIKEKVEQFEVPYNDAHWVEMEGKLNTIKAAKIKTTIFSSAAALFIIALASYFIYEANSTTHTESTISENTELTNDNKNSQLNNTINNSLSNNDEVKSNNNIDDATHNILPPKKSSINEEKNETKELTSEKETVDNNKNISTPIVEKNNSSVNLNADFIVYNNKVCLGETVSFESVENNRPVSYLWNFGDGTISYKTNPKHIYNDSRVYTVTLTLIDKKTGTEKTSKQYDIVQILPVPKAEFVYVEESTQHDDNKLKYPYTIFKVENPEDESSYEWNLGNGKLFSAEEVKTIHEKAGNYSVSLTVKNSEGCILTSERVIKIKNNFVLYSPNALRPSSTNPENAVFIPKALLEWDIPFEMIITNKAGKTIYKTSDRNEGWNGKLNNTGQQMDEGFYFWKIVTKDAENNSHYHQGEIQLIK